MDELQPSPAFPRLAALACVLLTLMACAAVATQGTWELTAAESFGSFYDAQALSLWHGHWDVPEPDIHNEGFVREGRYYGYFGPTPALLRLPLEGLLPGMMGRWSRLSVLLGVGLTMLAVLWLLRRAARDLGWGRASSGERVLAYACLLLCAGPGSTLLMLASRCYIYHEALVWGNALVLVAWALFLEAWERPRPATLLLFFGVGGLAVHATALVGAGVVAAAAALAGRALLELRAVQQPSLPVDAGPASGQAWSGRRLFVAACLGGCVTVASFLAVNYAKFAELEGHPMQLYVQCTPERWAKTDGVNFRLSNMPFNAMVQLVGTEGSHLRASFPWLQVGHLSPLQARFARARMDLVEFTMGLPQCEPVLLLLCLAGWGWLMRVNVPAGWRWSAATALMPGVVLLAYAVVSHRYLHYHYPWLLMGSVVGVHALLQMPVRSWRRAMLGLLVLGAVYTLWTSAAVALVFQNEVVWGTPPEAVARYRSLQERVDRWTGLIPGRPPAEERPSAKAIPPGHGSPSSQPGSSPVGPASPLPTRP